MAGKRLARGRLTVVDATGFGPGWCRRLVRLAAQHHVRPVAIVLGVPGSGTDRRPELPEEVDGAGPGSGATGGAWRASSLEREGFWRVFVLASPAEITAARVVRRRLPVDRRDDHGPFDVVGDVHGCFDELRELLGRLGYDVAARDDSSEPGWSVAPPDGRKLVFVGDLVDRGPRVVDVLRLVMDAVAAGAALCVPGNHDDKLLRYLQGRNVRIRHGLEVSVRQLAGEPPAFRERVKEFLRRLPSHLVLDGGRLVVAHAGIKAAMQGRDAPSVRDFVFYGETTGETDEFGLPVRLDWAADYRGDAHVVYGHTPRWQPGWVNRTINVDSGCVFGGALTALRWPERELVSVPARRVYAETARQFLPADRLLAMPA